MTNSSKTGTCIALLKAVDRANLAQAHHKRGRRQTALLIVDMLNTLDFPGGKKLLPRALRAARKILKLKQRARQKGLPVIYVNDNLGHWRSEWGAIYQKCLSDTAEGKALAKLLKPDPTDYFILKPKHSAFYCTSLEVLLEHLRVKKLIITGIAADICVLFSAQDAHIRGYEISVPCDCVASESSRHERAAMALMRKAFAAQTQAMSLIAF